MIVKNKETLVNNALTDKQRRARRMMLDIVESALNSVHPRSLIMNKISVDGKYINIAGFRINKSEARRIYVVGAGKGSGYLAEAVEEKIGEHIEAGIVSVLSGTSGYFKTKKIKILESSHPIPDDKCIHAAERIFNLINEADDRDLILCLITGGGSALITYPAEGIALKDLQDTHKTLLSSGANIIEMNAIKKHLSRIAGGWLAKRAYPKKIISLIISDVVGDRIDTIGAGPTAPDQTTFKDCLSVIDKYSIRDRLPASIIEYLNEGVNGLRPETLKESDPVFKNVKNIIIGSNRIALNNIVSLAEKTGYNPLLLSSTMEGEARELGVFLINIAKEIAETDKPVQKPALIVCGGETTVTLKGEPGLGGRNQTVTLSAITKINSLENITVCCVGTDGLDGNSKAAGAISDTYTLRKAGELGLNPDSYLSSFNTNTFFNIVGDEIITGPTGTNVNDIYMVMVS
ncbi:MAG: glycerate kinase [Candidatus Odinarchaeota archaeon]